jgi:hypothetical protein
MGSLARKLRRRGAKEGCSTTGGDSNGKPWRCKNKATVMVGGFWFCEKCAAEVRYLAARRARSAEQL